MYLLIENSIKWTFYTIIIVGDYMKKMSMVTSIALTGMIGLGAYVLMNKQTKDKADKLLNNMLDKANDCTMQMCR